MPGKTDDPRGQVVPLPSVPRIRTFMMSVSSAAATTSRSPLTTRPSPRGPEPDQESGDDCTPLATRATPETLKGLCGWERGGESDYLGAKAGTEDCGETWVSDIP